MSDRTRFSLLCLLAFLLFAVLRLTYWGSISEEPFSDMADYFFTAHKFLCCLDLGHSQFWQSYMKPVLPILGAGVFAIFGKENLLAWRFCLAVVTFLSALIFALELRKATKNNIISVGFLIVVAISKSSIFWSYKFATEGIAEALIYCALALSLALLREQRPRPLLALALGVTFMIASYNRPSTIIVAPILALVILLRGASFKNLPSIRQNLPNLLYFTSGVLAIILPFAIRSYSLYGHVLVSPTQGAYSFIWELGKIEVKEDDGSTVTKDVFDLQGEAATKFANDYEASNYARKFARAWLSKNWDGDYPKIIRNRFFTSIWQYDIALSKVPRTQILPDSTAGLLLVDKSPIFILLGAIGLGLFCFSHGLFWIVVPSMAVLPWLFGVFFISDPRLLEPALPLVLFGNIAMIAHIIRAGKNRLFSHSNVA